MPDQFLHGVKIVEATSGARTIRTVNSAVIGVIGTAPDASADDFPLNTPVLIAGSQAEAAKLGETGTLPDALAGILDQVGAVVVVVRVEDGETDAATIANIIGGVDAETGKYHGMQAFYGAEDALGFAPRILIAPEYTNKEGVLTALGIVATRLRAIIFADGPDTTDAAAIAAATAAASDRVMLIDPAALVLDSAGAKVPRAPSAIAAGVQALIDQDEGFWVSLSNHQIAGIVGTTRGVDFSLGDVSSRANLLNEKNVTTIIRKDGFRFWGNRTTAAEGSQYAFLCVRRTADMINESILRAHLWAVDRNITKTYLDSVVESVNAYLRDLTAQGAILGGECWPDPDLNTATAIAAGKVYFNFNFTPTYPAESITFTSILDNGRLSELVA